MLKNDTKSLSDTTHSHENLTDELGCESDFENYCQLRLKDNSQNILSYTEILNHQWSNYEQNYFALLEKLNKTQINASELIDKYLHVANFKNFFFVETGTKTVQISCIDEGTQFENLSFEIDLEDNLVLEDNTSSKYILDIAGSGAYNYACPSFTKNISISEAVTFEKARMIDLANRIYNWCAKKGIENLIVTFHKNCGAVMLRCVNFPGLLNTQDFILLESKKCAQKLARTINEIAKSKNTIMKVTLGLINEEQICKFRPMNMHNALGTVCILDSNVAGKKIDILTGLNFFNVLSLSDFSSLDEAEPELQNVDFKIDTIEHSIRNISLSISIAFGKHGWGETFFNEEKPFIVFFMTRDEFQIFQSEQVIEQLKKDHSNKNIKYTIINTNA